MCLLILSAGLFSQKTGAGDTLSPSDCRNHRKKFISFGSKWVADLLGFQSFEDAAIWADNVRYAKNWKHRSTIIIKILGTSTTFRPGTTFRKRTAKRRCSPSDLRAEDVLRESTSTGEEKTIALRFMIHFVADLHQPLHVGYKEDVGGNDTKLTWYGKKRTYIFYGIPDSFIKIWRKKKKHQTTPSDFAKINTRSLGSTMDSMEKIRNARLVSRISRRARSRVCKLQNRQ